MDLNRLCLPQMALQQLHENLSYVHYPEPEPYTPTTPPEADPWRMSGAEQPGPPHDTPDHVMPHYDPSRRLSTHQQFPRPTGGPPNVVRQSSYVQDMPRRGSYAQGLPRRQSYAGGPPRRDSRSGNMELRNGRPAPIAENRWSADVSPVRKLPTRRGSLQPIPEPPKGDKNKLWYSYLTEEPDYFSRAALERNRRRSKVWTSDKGDRPVSSPPAHRRPQRRESFSQPQLHRQPQQRPQSFPPHLQTHPYQQTQPPPFSQTSDSRGMWI